MTMEADELAEALRKATELERSTREAHESAQRERDRLIGQADLVPHKLGWIAGHVQLGTSQVNRIIIAEAQRRAGGEGQP